MISVERRLAALEARLARLRPLPTTIDGLDLNELSYWRSTCSRRSPASGRTIISRAGLCAAVVAACDRPPAERSTAVGMAVGRYWPEASGDPMELMAALTSSGLLPGAADDRRGAVTVIRLSDRLAKLERRLEPAPSRGLVEAERRLIAMANEIGVDVRDPVALMALIEATLEQLATGRRR